MQTDRQHQLGVVLKLQMIGVLLRGSNRSEKVHHLHWIMLPPRGFGIWYSRMLYIECPELINLKP